MEDMAMCVIHLAQLLKIFDVHVPELQHALQFMRSVGVEGDALPKQDFEWLLAFADARSKHTQSPMLL